MKKLSFWALLNPMKAQFIILICQVLLGILTFYSGVWLFAQGIIIPISVAYFGMVLFFVALICYPIRRAKYRFWKTSFVKQKAMDATLVLSFVMMNIQISNNEALLACREPSPTLKAVKVVMHERPKSIVADPIETMTPYTWSIESLHKKLKKELRTMKAYDESLFVTALKILGVILFMSMLFVAVLFLSCAIGCNIGNGILVNILLIGGTAAVLLGSIIWIRDIVLKRKDNYVPMPKS